MLLWLVVASSCLTTAPRWMETHRDLIQNLTLRGMFLPGTHNSAAYLHSCTPFRETLVEKFTFNQGESVLQQLIYGARVLDLRVGHYPFDSQPWSANHGKSRIRPLYQVLDEIILFVNMTQEIVVLDFHHFPVGFDKNTNLIHQALLEMLEDRLGEYLIEPALGWDASLSAMWQTGRRVVLAYNYPLGGLNTSFAWPGVSHQWADTTSMDDLHSYLREAMTRKHSSAWAAMAELTPTLLHILMGQLGSLRHMAHSTNHNVTEWYQGDWGAQCNIVSVDFLRSSAIVNTAINWNLRRARGQLCDPR